MSFETVARCCSHLVTTRFVSPPGHRVGQAHEEGSDNQGGYHTDLLQDQVLDDGVS